MSFHRLISHFSNFLTLHNETERNSKGRTEERESGRHVCVLLSARGPVQALAQLLETQKGFGQKVRSEGPEEPASSAARDGPVQVPTMDPS